MPRYISQQPQEYSCGPIAIINAGKWAGNHLTRKNDFNRVYKNTYCNIKGTGTCVGHIDRVLRKELGKYINILKVRNTCHLACEKHIKQGGAILLSFSFKSDLEPNNEGCHIALFTDIWQLNWVGHNVYSRSPTSFVSYETILEYFYNTIAKTTVWFLKRK